MYTFGSSTILTGYDRAVLPRIVAIFVLETCYAAVAARSKRRSKRKGRVTKIYNSHQKKSLSAVSNTDRLEVEKGRVGTTERKEPQS